jgi:hypothetical protein
MENMTQIIGLLLLVSIAIYLHANFRFYQIILELQPEWIDKKGRLSSIYAGLSRLSDPNVSIAVTRLAFSSRWRSLENIHVSKYVKRIRILLPSSVVLFLAYFTVVQLYAN